MKGRLFERTRRGRRALQAKDILDFGLSATKLEDCANLRKILTGDFSKFVPVIVLETGYAFSYLHGTVSVPSFVFFGTALPPIVSTEPEDCKITKPRNPLRGSVIIATLDTADETMKA